MDTNTSSRLDRLRLQIRARTVGDEAQLLRGLVDEARLDPGARRLIDASALALVRGVRAEGGQPLMESFLAEYGLSTSEGVGLMCLAEALLRVPDAQTIDDLIRDKIEPSDWGAHLGRSSSPLVNASTWALMLTGRLLDEDAQAGPVGALRGLVRRLGEPVVRLAVAQAMKALGQQFVLGQTIGDAIRRGAPMREQGCTYSYDMLGEAARTATDAARYQQSYAQALVALESGCGADIRANPGVSVKLSALHPRYEYLQRKRVMAEMVPRVLELAMIARNANMGFNIDAEEADRLELSLDVVQAVLSETALAGWDGFGVVVQAYGKRAPAVLDWLHTLAAALDRRIMVRLVKGAYWDSEIKHAQELGLRDFPVFTRKVHTDISYIACARKLLSMTDRIYPQFATHNAHTCAAVLAMADDRSSFEFQRLHGMGEALHRLVMARAGTRCRIYAPVGAHRDLLAYLVRRLLENGANSSFVNQIADERVGPEAIARDPFDAAGKAEPSTGGLGGGLTPNPAIVPPPALFRPLRENSRGWNPNDAVDVDGIVAARERFRQHRWSAAPMLAAEAPHGLAAAGVTAREVRNPADPADVVGTVAEASPQQVAMALAAAGEGHRDWGALAANRRAEILRRAAGLYETHAIEFFALCAREAGKTLKDAIAELREAVDFLLYYAAEAERLESTSPASRGRGVFASISPWNFPLAIFTGQVAAALAAGNAVIAKPAEQTPLIAARAVELLREAGVPPAALQLLPGDGSVVGAGLVRSASLAGVLFTGSTEVAQSINRSLAKHAAPEAVLVAETGGLNAMIVDSTALPEQAVRDILASAFQSAGQRCSALRILYVQEDVGERMLEMLAGAIDQLTMGDPWLPETDVGPVIDEQARRDIQGYCDQMASAGRLVKRLWAPTTGHFIGPQVLAVAGIAGVAREVFGPVLHVATFQADRLDQVVADINARGYGLTFGLHSRIDDRVQRVVESIRAGNIYVNRNQIGAVVGSQPFGGEGLSGTGPKAGGPGYLPRLVREWPAGTDGSATAGAAAAWIMPASSAAAPVIPPTAAVPTPLPAAAPFLAAVSAAVAATDASGWAARNDRLAILQRTLGPRLGGQAELLFEAVTRIAGSAGTQLAMPGPTGESNRLWHVPRGTALCLGPGLRLALGQALQALAAGAGAIVIVDLQSPSEAGEGHEGAARALADFRAWQSQGLPLALVDASRMPPDPGWLQALPDIALVACAAAPAQASALRQALAARDGAIVPLVTDAVAPARYLLERLLCIDTTAAGGNASLLAASDGAASLSVSAGGM